MLPGTGAKVWSPVSYEDALESRIRTIETVLPRHAKEAQSPRLSHRERAQALNQERACARILRICRTELERIRTAGNR